VLVGVVFTVGQLLESYVLTPRIVGDKIGLHPVAVIFAVMAGGQLFGFLGMLIALPAAAVINVLLRYAAERYRQSGLYMGAQPTPAIVLEPFAAERATTVEATPQPPLHKGPEARVCPPTPAARRSCRWPCAIGPSRAWQANSARRGAGR